MKVLHAYLNTFSHFAQRWSDLGYSEFKTIRNVQKVVSQYIINNDKKLQAAAVSIRNIYYHWRY